MSKPAALDVETIARAANGRAFELAAHCLPNGRRSADRRHWETNCLADNPRPDGGYSLKVDITGSYAGQWRDFATGEHGDMIDLIRLTMFGGDKGEAIKWLKSWLGLDDLDPGRLQRVRYQAEQKAIAATEEAAQRAEARKRGARALWLNAQPIAGTPGAGYLAARGLQPLPVKDGQSEWPGSLRFHEEVFHTGVRVKLPAMVATMVTPAGVQVATHRTYLGRHPLTRAWVKAEEADLGVARRESKKVLGKCGGAFVPICKGASGKSMGQLTEPETVYVTEGIENALTVALIRPGFRVVAAYSVDNIGAIEFPELIERIVICCDRDKPPLPGRRGAIDALEAAIAKQQARGKLVETVYPPAPHKDFNDALQAMLRAHDQGAAA